jgi:hypothetical protein
LLKGGTTNVTKEISRLKQMVRENIKILQSYENELELQKGSLIELLSIMENHAVQIDIEQDATLGRSNDRIYQFSVSNGLLSWEIKN